MKNLVLVFSALCLFFFISQNVLAAENPRQLPENTVCLVELSTIQCSSNGSDTYNGYPAHASCFQTAVFRTATGTFESIMYQGDGRSYGAMLDEAKARSNAKAEVRGKAAAAGIIPGC